jgi:hypothetical protein
VPQNKSLVFTDNMITMFATSGAMRVPLKTTWQQELLFKNAMG